MKLSLSVNRLSSGIWISTGKPLNNTLHSIMKKTRNRYNFQIRKCRKAAEMLKRNNLLNVCITGEGDIFHLLNACIAGEGDIFHELKKLRGERYCANNHRWN